MRWWPVALGVAVTIASCAKHGGDSATPPSEGAGAEAPAEAEVSSTRPKSADDTPTECASAPGWRYERIELPPEFAPTMDKGAEILFFHPGMFDPKSPGYWTYVFALSFDGPPAPLEPMLTAYYRGLIGAVAKGKNTSYDLDAVKVSLTATADGQHTASVELFDAFVTGEPLRIEMRLAVEGNCVGASVAPVGQPPALWQAIAGARKCLAC